MKTLTYSIKGYTAIYNEQTKEVEQCEIATPVTVECATQEEFDANYAHAQDVVIDGTIEVSGEFNDETQTLESRVETLEADQADIAEALEMILTGVVE